MDKPISVFVAKEINGETVESDRDTFTDLFCGIDDKDFIVKVKFFDISLKKEHQGEDVINVDFEDRENINEILLNSARESLCDVMVVFNQNTAPKEKFIETLCEDLTDDNIFATYSDYSADGIPLVQNLPIVICRRIDDENALYNTENCKGVIKYIPMDLYDIFTKV